MGGFNAVAEPIVSLRYNQAMVEAILFIWMKRGALLPQNGLFNAHFIYNIFSLTGLLFLLVNACQFQDPVL